MAQHLVDGDHKIILWMCRWAPYWSCGIPAGQKACFNSMILNPTTSPSYVSVQDSWWAEPVPISLGQFVFRVSSGLLTQSSNSVVTWLFANSPTHRSLLKEVTVLFIYSLQGKRPLCAEKINKCCEWPNNRTCFFFPLTIKKKLKWGVETALEDISTFSKKNHKHRITTQPSNSTPGPLPPPQNETCAMKRVTCKYL